MKCKERDNDHTLKKKRTRKLRDCNPLLDDSCMDVYIATSHTIFYGDKEREGKQAAPILKSIIGGGSLSIQREREASYGPST
jgi:hypothetical protein